MADARVPRTVNLAEVLRSGEHYGVFIDDSGSPGAIQPGLHANRKTWVAVLVQPQRMAEVMDQIPSALSYLSELGIRRPEFHFVDIWAPKGEYAKLSLKQRLGIFAFMAHIFATYRFQVLVQTFDPSDAMQINAAADWPDAFGPLRVKDHEELALIFLLLRAKAHIEDELPRGSSGCVIVDEWKRFKSGRSFQLSGLAPAFYEGAVLFADSRLAPPIQLADFAAFVVNRWQVLRVKAQLTEVDKAFLEAVAPLTECASNIDNVKVHGWPAVQSLRQGMQ